MRTMQQDERGTFDDTFDVTEEDIKTANEPPKPWEKGTKATATVKSFVKSEAPGPSGAHYWIAGLDLVRDADGAHKAVRDNSLSLAAKSKGKFVQFCQCFGLAKLDEINAVRRGELSPVGLSGPVVVGQEDGQDGNTYNRVAAYRRAKLPF
jgi:hypothetical protein